MSQHPGSGNPEVLSIGNVRASIERRMGFAARSLHTLDSLASTLCRGLKLELDHSYHLVLHRFLQLAYDLGESVRTRRVVPHFGDVRAAVDRMDPPIPQMRGEEGFSYDKDHHILVGTQIGVDLILNSGKYYVLDLNAEAAMRPERRKIFASEFDPVVSNLVATAQQLGFRRLVAIRSIWEGIEHEWVRAGANCGVEVIPACYAWFNKAKPYPVARFPLHLEADTMYVSFGPRYSPFEFFINDKLCFYRWLSKTLVTHPVLGLRLAVPETSERLNIPVPDPDESRPNLVVKATGKACGAAVGMARITTPEEAMNAFGMSHEKDFPRVFREGPVMTFLDKLFGRDKLLFQHYLAPGTDEAGCAQIYRLHLLVSPLAHRFLAVHKVTAPVPLPQAPVQGLVPDPCAYVVNYSRGGSYSLLSADEEESIRVVAEDLGLAIQTAARATFTTAVDPSAPQKQRRSLFPAQQ